MAHAQTPMPREQAHEIVHLDLGPIAMRRMDADFVMSAVLERQLAALDAGVTFTITDFVRDALIEAAHR